MEHLISKCLRKFNRLSFLSSAIKSESILNKDLSKLSSVYPVSKRFRRDGAILNLSPPSHIVFLQRLYSDHAEPPKLQLMDFSIIVWPGLIKSIKNWIYTMFIVKPYLDPDFTLSEFVEGTKQAAVVVSNRLAEGNLESLEGLLTPGCLEEVRRNLNKLSTKQRHELAIKPKDIYFSFPYELGILFSDAKDGEPQKRHVEVTVVHHLLRGYTEMVERGESVPLDMGTRPEYRDKIFILNYRFIRNYSKGVTDQWTINVVNHFKPVEFS